MRGIVPLLGVSGGTIWPGSPCRVDARFTRDDAFNIDDEIEPVGPASAEQRKAAPSYLPWLQSTLFSLFLFFVSTHHLRFCRLLFPARHNSLQQSKALCGILHTWL